ncbi:hypothetical protein DSCA_47520 [Desulfosarcina alkanivorans]|uniref:Uncharacterized protein n=1 Tax=Desulfosarcina alkanivorans TaxID=571177 RepID=A0A5K7YM43_9BACT|nr:hypothetical protein [Desulfosarcina alkanivorans]BBO70822.1 hypothetical protein DSCA_47520 [Desulfosarcina alkanivorans]
MILKLIASLAAVIFLFPAQPNGPAALASTDMPAEIEKTFDSGTLIEHTVSVKKGFRRVSLRLSQRREAEGSVCILSAHLTFHPGTVVGKPLLTTPMFESLLADMINALYGRLGPDLKLESLGAGRFMGIKAVEKKSILAFSGYAPWEDYVKNPGGFSQQRIYDIVRERWKAAGVFSAVTRAFAPLGYEATFAGFEKLFVFPAEKCSFYPEMADLGIRKTDRFPYPGTISFNLTQRP